MPTLYLDACCVNRPFDDQRHPRIRLEAEAVLLVVQRVATGEWSWVASAILTFEVEQIADAERLRRVRAVLSAATQWVRVEEGDVTRGEWLESLGFADADALHIACAERGGADVFLTTDDRLLRLATRHRDALRLRVANPLTWVTEELGR